MFPGEGTDLRKLRDKKITDHSIKARILPSNQISHRLPVEWLPDIRSDSS
jgi:hypothetical protein